VTGPDAGQRLEDGSAHSRRGRPGRAQPAAAGPARDPGRRSDPVGRHVSQLRAAATRMGRRASLSIHGPNRTAGLIYYVTDNSPPTLRVGRNLHKHRRAGGPFRSIRVPTRDRGRGGPLSRMFFPESERTGPPVGSRPHSTARALPGGRVRVGPGGSAR
jgi:hypothetical protein